MILDFIKFILVNKATLVILVIIITFIVQIILRWVLQTALHSYLKHTAGLRKAEEIRREKTLVRVLRTILAVVLWVVSVIVILAVLEVDLGALITGAGAAGLAIGIIGQSTIKNYISGFFIILENQYRINDILEASTSAGVFFGVVEDISIRTTKLRDLDGSLHIVPNGTIILATNHTYLYGNIVADILVSYDTDIEQVEKIINQVGNEMAEDPEWKKYILEPVQFYRVNSLNETSVTIKAIGKANTAGMQWMAAGEYRKRIRVAFSKNNIPLPNQNVVVHDSDNPANLNRRKK